MSPDAQANASILQALGVPLESIASYLSAAATLQPGDWIIDALLGTGQTRPLTGELAEVVTAINDSSARVLAIDLPTGFPADHGPAAEDECCVIAHATITFVSPKQGFLNPLARRFLGETHIASIGLPHDQLLSAVRGRE
jgi:NAD(P)H-hydrate epimerase